MKKNLLFAGLIVGLLWPHHARAVLFYWDVNGTVAGAGGNGAPSGNISGTSYWSLVANGTGATTTWPSGNTAVFSAGTDATNTYTVTLNSPITAAGIIVEEGYVKLAASSAITIGTGTVAINSGTTLSLDNSARLSASAGSVLSIEGGTIENTVTGANGSFIPSSMTITVGAGGATLSYTTPGVLNILQTGTPGSSIDGTGGISKTGAGILAIATACTYGGSTTINNGTLRTRGLADRLPTGTDVIINSPGVFDPAVSQSVQTVNGNGAITFSGSGTLTISGDANSTLSGPISDGAVFGKIFKSGSGTLTLSGTNTYDGTFDMATGVCTVMATGTLIGPAGDLVVNGGMLNLNNAAQTVENFSGAGGTVILGAGHILTSVAVGNATYSGKLSGAGGINYDSPALVQTLSGANDYSGGTSVKSGTLEVQRDGGLGLGNVSVLDGATLLLDGGATNGYINSSADLVMSGASSLLNLRFTGTNTIHALSFDGGVTYQPVGTYGANGGHITGTGFLQVTATPNHPGPITIASNRRTNVVLTWPGLATLQSATNGLTSWLDVNGAASPYTNTATGKQQYFRLRN